MNAIKDDPLKQSLDWICDDEIFAKFKTHGNTCWSLKLLATTALLWSWNDRRGLRERFQTTLEILPHWFPRAKWGTTYQGFVKTLRRWSTRLVPILVLRLRERMQHVAGTHWKCAGWVVMAVDGTRIETPRTEANQKYFGHGRLRSKKSRRKTKSPKRKKIQSATPQVWLTAIWNVGCGLLWDWRQGHGDSSERTHLREMLGDLPKKTLLTLDAGFYGYDFWQAILDSGNSFLVRVGGNIRLLKGLGYVRRQGNIVCFWPSKARRHLQPPVVLRLFECHDGRGSVFLVTNVLDEKELSRHQALEIYRRRWGVELFFRGFKQTFGRGKLKSHVPGNVELELDWSLLAIWSLELLSVKALLECGRVPGDLSTSGALKAVRETMNCVMYGSSDEDFPWRLAAIRDDGYRRRRKTRCEWPRKKPRKPPGNPIVCRATEEEILAAYKLKIQAC